jgi:hypothetical protein
MNNGARIINRRLSQISNTTGLNPTVTRKVLALVVESGSVYSSALLVQIILYFMNSNGFFIAYDPITQLMVSSLPVHALYELLFSLLGLPFAFFPGVEN